MFTSLSTGEDTTILVWIVVPPPEVKAAAAEVQQAFAEIDGILPLPSHFLHVTVGRVQGPPGPEEWAAVEPFRVEYRRVGCFHEAVVGEVHGEGLRRLAEPIVGRPYLPHLSLGYVREPMPPAELRDALRPLRERLLGEQLVDEVTLVRVPFSRTTLLEPWTVLTTYHLG
jgi:2'-5' RNA ligase